MGQPFAIGEEPVPGYKVVESLGGSGFYRMWKVIAPDNSTRQWKQIDMVIGNAAVETRTLGLLIKLRHPRLNTLTNFWQLDEGRTLVIETEFPVMSLQDRLNQSKKAGQPIPLDELQAYIAHAAEGLDFLNSPRHEFEGKRVAVYHRALRPECLHVFREGARQVCKVSDFGIAKPVTDGVSQHSQGLQHYDYDPPEFFEGQTTPTSDQYSLAIVYYELRTGELPFQGTMLEQLQARLDNKPNLGLLPGAERQVVAKALSRDPEERYENCLAFARQLKLNKAPQAGAAPERPRELPASSPAAPTPRAPSPASAPRPTAPSPGDLSASRPAVSPGIPARRPMAPPPASAIQDEPPPPVTTVAPVPPAPAGTPAAVPRTEPDQIPGVVFHRPPPSARPSAGTLSPEGPDEPGAKEKRGVSDTAQRLKGIVDESRASAGAGHNALANQAAGNLRHLRQQLGDRPVLPTREPEPAEFRIPLVWASMILALLAVAVFFFVYWLSPELFS